MRRAPLFVSLFSVIVGCGTSIRAHHVPAGKPEVRKGGIPFFVPRPVLLVRQPVEVNRSEDIYAVLELGGVYQFLFHLTERDLDDGIDRLKRYLGIAGPVTLEPAKLEAGVLVEESEVTTGADKSTTTETRKYQLGPQVAPSEGKSEVLYSVADADKAFSVLFVPDTTREYELMINPKALSSSTVSVTLADGWRLTGLNAEGGEGGGAALATVAQAALTAAGGVSTVAIEAAQAVKLAAMAQPGGGKGTGAGETGDAEPGKGNAHVGLGALLHAFQTPTGQDSLAKMLNIKPDSVRALIQQASARTTISVKVVGYLKKVVTEQLRPGVYDLGAIVRQGGTKDLPLTEAVLWQRLSFTQPAAGGAAPKS